MKLNGKELSDKEEIAFHQREIRRLRKVVKTADYRDGANALDKIRITYERVNHLKAKIKIEQISQKMYNTRNSKEFYSFQKRIDKLRNFIQK